MRVPAVALALTLALVAPACSDGDGDGGEPEVVATVGPLADAARRIGGGRLDVSALVPAGAEPHDLEPDTAQIDRLSDADLVLTVGGGFQPAIEEVAGRRDDGTRSWVASGDDPHFWLDPVVMRTVVDDVVAAFVELDPAGADGFRRRGEELREDLAAVDAAYRDGLAECERRTVITAHAAFGRLARRYDLDQQALTGAVPEAEPDPARFAELTDLARDTGATTVFTEPLAPPAVADAFARAAGGLDVAVLDPLETSGRSGYLAGMRANLAALRRALGCR